MTERERLIELLNNKIDYGVKVIESQMDDRNNFHDIKTNDLVADYLLANGVIIPPCKVGDTVYEICLGKLSGQKTIKQSKVTAIKITDKLTITLDYTTNFYDTDIGSWLFVGNNAKEEAEKALKGIGE